MKILQILGCVVLAIVGLTVFGKIRQKMGAGASASDATVVAGAPAPSAAGFILLKPEEAKNPRVTILTAPNCPSHESQRARDLQASLQAAGVPCELSSHIGFSFTDMKAAERVQKFMDKVPFPLVLVRGWAKGNPSATEVIAQYQSGS